MSDSSAPAVDAAPAQTAPADTGGELTILQAARLYTARPKTESTAESADDATAETELPEKGDAGPAEEPTPGEDTPEAKPAEEPPIERPRSWTKEEDTEWQSLPRTMQQKIVAREQERDTGLRRSQNEAAEKLKGLTAKEQEAEQAKQRYEAQLPALMQTLQDTNQVQFGDIRTVDDVTKLAAEDPFRYLQWQAHQTKLQAAAAENERVKGEKARASQTERQTRRASETALLIEKVPEFADGKKLDAAQKAAAKLFSDVGYSDAELTALSNDPLLDDHRIQLIVNDALKFRALQAAKVAAIPKPVPQVQRPGSARPAGSANSERIQALETKLNQSGSLADAHALRVARGNAARRTA